MYNPIGRIHKFFAKIRGQRWTKFNRFANMSYINKRDLLKYVRKCRVVIVGIGKIGKFLVYFLKMNLDGLMELRVCHRSNLEGIIPELDHISMKSPVRMFKHTDRLPLGPRSVDVILLTIGASGEPNTRRRHLFAVLIIIWNCRHLFIIVAHTEKL